MTAERAAAVARANARLTHRGPDGEGQWASAEAGPGAIFAHRRLAILDLSPRGAQPMVDEVTGNAIAFNGEIYNFGDLRRALEAEGVAFASDTDTEVLLKGYRVWGREVLPRLRGMFAFALWDARKRGVLLARDPMGIKPLYLTHGAAARDGVAFASEVRALLAGGLAAPRLDRVGLATYHHNGFVVGPRTILEQVRLLPPGSSIWVDAEGRVEEPPRPFFELPAAAPGDAEPAVAALRAALADAVRLRLIADVPLGVFLSGGIDSSAVAALATEAAGGPIDTFNVAFEEMERDESPYAERVAAALGARHHRILLTQRDFAARLPEALDGLDQPTFDGVNTWFVSRAVRDAGITVALAGTGGDELFGGYTSFADLPRAARAARALRPVPGAAFVVAGRSTARAHALFGRVAPQTRWGKLADVLATRGDLLALYQCSYALFTHAFLDELSTVAAEAPDGLPAERRPALAALVGGRAALPAVSDLELRLFLGERLLRDTDTTSMASALEVRVPLIDVEVQRALARVPLDRRYEPLRRKALLRELGLRGLDPAIFERPKSGFELPLARWTRDRLAAQLDAAFGDDAACAAVGLRGPAVRRLWRSYRAGAPGLYWSRVWSLYVLIDWARRHAATLA